MQIGNTVTARYGAKAKKHIIVNLSGYLHIRYYLLPVNRLNSPNPGHGQITSTGQEPKLHEALELSGSFQ